MSATLWLNNFGAYWLQVAIIVVAGASLAAASRVRAPRAIYVYWQALLAACMILPLIQPWQQAATGSVEILGISLARFAPAEAASRLIAWPSARVVLLVISAGILLRLAWLAAAYGRLRRTVETAPLLEPCPEFTRELSMRLGVRARFHLVPGLGSPATFGIGRPRILLPSRFADLNEQQQQAILAHELLHAARRDWAFNLAEEFVLAIFWFHPGVWWLIRRIRLSREQVVDGEVVKLVGARRDYLDALLEIAAQVKSPALAAAPFLNESQLAERIRMLVKEDVMSKRRIILTVCGLAVLTLAAGMAAVRAFPLSAPGSPPEELKTAGKPPLKILKKTQPVYPSEAKVAGIQGVVVLECTVAKDGHVSDVKVISGDPNLAESATQAVKQWQFAPLDKAPAVTKIEINYTLADKKPGASSKGNESAEFAKVSDKGVVAPVPLEKPDPKYTPEAKAGKVQGIVKLSIVIEPDGTVGDVKVIQSLEKSLDQSAVDTVKTWKFKPATKDGKPVAVKSDIEIMFALYAK